MLALRSRHSARIGTLALSPSRRLARQRLLVRPYSSEPAGAREPGERSSLPVRTQAELAPIPPRQSGVGRALPPKEADYVTVARRQFNRKIYFGAAFVSLVIGCIIYLTYELEKLFKVWPEELRVPLRQAVRAEWNEQWPAAEVLWRQAFNLALTPEVRPKLTLLQLTGIATCYADMLITHALAPQRARPILLAALAEMDAHSVEFTPLERQRRLGILSKLAEVAEKLKKPEEEEKYLTAALQDALKGVIEVRRAARKKFVEKRTDGLEDLPTPNWVSRADIAICCENLAAYYVRTGNGDYANSLYLHAINTVLPPIMPGTETTTTPEPTLDEVCRGAHLMTNLASSLLTHPSSENIRLAGVWATKSLQAANAGQDSPELASMRGSSDLTLQEEDTKRTCDRVKAVALFNMGIIASMNQNYDEARMFLSESARQSKKIGYVKGETEAVTARRKVSELSEIQQASRRSALVAGKM